jgi:hypothetical protein
MTLTGKAAEELHARLKAEAQQRRADQLAAAKADAARRGKEPFDLAKLETLCDTSREGRIDPEETRRARFEELYYTHYPDVLTLAELARKVSELNRW